MAHKKLFFKLLGAFILFTAVAMPVSALAQTEAVAKPGIFFYLVDTTFEKVGLFFTFNSEKKARKALVYADKRLAEIEAIDETGKPDVLKSLIANYENNIALAVKKSKDITDKEKAEELFTSIAENTSKNQEVLSAVLIKVPEEAKEAIAQAIEASKKNQEEALQQIAELKKEVSELKEEVQKLKEELQAKNEAQEVAKQKKDENGEDKNEKEIEELKKDIEKLEKEIKQSETKETKTETGGNNTVTLPNGSVVEMDRSGNIVRTIKEIPINSEIPVKQSSGVFISDFKVISSPSFSERNISSVRVEWKTSIPTESKLFLTNSDGAVQIYKSQTGLSTNHFTNFGSFESVTYLYEIEVIGKDDFAKKSGKFTVQARPASVPTKMKIYSYAIETFLDDPLQRPFEVGGSKCWPTWFGVIVIDQYGNEMANQKVTLNTPAGSITKTTSEESFNPSVSSYGERFYYSPETSGTKETISFAVGNLITIATIYVKDTKSYLKSHIVLRDSGVWVEPISGAEVNAETMTCVSNKPVLY